MRKSGKSGNGNFKSGQLAAKAYVVAPIFSCIVLVFAGCANNQTRTPERDPLFGSPAIPKQPSSGSTVSQTEVKASAPAVPTLPSTTSNAALATGYLPGAEPLSIPGKETSSQRWQGNQNAQKSPSGWTGQAIKNPGPGGVTLQQPVAVEESVPTVTRSSPSGKKIPGAINNPSPVPAVKASIEHLRFELKKRVLWQDEKKTPQGIHLMVGIANPQRPDMQRLIDVTAPDQESALRAVLSRIDQQ